MLFYFESDRTLALGGSMLPLVVVDFLPSRFRARWGPSVSVVLWTAPLDGTPAVAGLGYLRRSVSWQKALSLSPLTWECQWAW